MTAGVIFNAFQTATEYLFPEEFHFAFGFVFAEEFVAFVENLRQSTVTCGFRGSLTGVARRRMARSFTRMDASIWPSDGTSCRARLTFGFLFGRVEIFHHVTLFRTVMNATLQRSATLPATRGRFRVVARPKGRFVTSNTRYRYFNLTLRMGQLFDFDNLHWSIPWANGLEVLILGYNLNGVVTLGFARMLTVGCVVFQSAHFQARWTISLMTVMRICMVTL